MTKKQTDDEKLKKEIIELTQKYAKQITNDPVQVVFFEGKLTIKEQIKIQKGKKIKTTASGMCSRFANVIMFEIGVLKNMAKIELNDIIIHEVCHLRFIHHRKKFKKLMKFLGAFDCGKFTKNYKKYPFFAFF